MADDTSYESEERCLLIPKREKTNEMLSSNELKLFREDSADNCFTPCSDFGSSTKPSSDPQGQDTKPCVDAKSRKATVRKPNRSFCRSNDRNRGMDGNNQRRLVFAIVLCTLSVVFESLGGYLANSSAIASEALYLLLDLLGLVIILVSFWVTSRPASERMTFGWHRAEVVGSLASVLLIWLITGSLIIMSIGQIIRGQHEVQPNILLLTASIGVVVNVALSLTLRLDNVSHGQKSSGAAYQRATDSNNTWTVFDYILCDLLNSLGVFLAAIIVYIKPNYALIDPIFSIVFSSLVFVTSFSTFREQVNLVMEGVPENIDFREVERTLFYVPGVVQVNSLRIWGLSPGKVALSAHLALSPDVEPSMVLKRASGAIRAEFDVSELTIQTEEPNEGIKRCT